MEPSSTDAMGASEPTADIGTISDRKKSGRSGRYRSMRALKLHLARNTNCQCYRCNMNFLFPDFVADHIIPLAVGGTDDDENVQLLCRVCHLQKTNIDVKIIRATRVLGYVTDTGIRVDPSFLRAFYLHNYLTAEQAGGMNLTGIRLQMSQLRHLRRDQFPSEYYRKADHTNY